LTIAPAAYVATLPLRSPPAAVAAASAAACRLRGEAPG
jgi:hypothetical protein